MFLHTYYGVFDPPRGHPRDMHYLDKCMHDCCSCLTRTYQGITGYTRKGCNINIINCNGFLLRGILQRHCNNVHYARTIDSFLVLISLLTLVNLIPFTLGMLQ